MAITAKFRVASVTTQVHHGGHHQDGKWNPTRWEDKTVKLSPVMKHPDPDNENTKFWQATPRGELELAGLAPEAAAAFEEGGEFYLIFTPAEPPAT